MGSSNLPLVIYYAVFALVGTLVFHFWKKKWWLGLLIGLGVALVVITVAALVLGG